MIDLHTHSTASDGSLTPTELLDQAAAAGLSGLALTDHDSLAGIAEARQAANALGLRFLPGVELSTAWEHLGEVHLLGYGRNLDADPDAALLAACARLRAARQRRVERIVAQLQAAGVGLSLASVLAAAGRPSGANQGAGHVAGHAALGRPHVARALVAGGWASDIADAFARWLVSGAPGYVAHERLETASAIKLIAAAGGVSVLAHPARLGLEPAALAAMVAELCRAGLGGIEVYWARHTPAEVELCAQLAAQHRLLATGGSDFHGAAKPDIKLGMHAGSALPLSLIDALGAGANL